jgi:hypothetical protein
MFHGGNLGTATNIRGNPFDFQRWRSWLEEKAEELRAGGYKTRYGFTDKFNKPKTHLDAISNTTGGYFTNWVTGETDFAVLDTKSGQNLENKMGLILDDSTFESAFEDFRKHLRI